MFTIGDVLYITGMAVDDSIVIITDITCGLIYEDYTLPPSNSDDVFYHIEVLDGYFYGWFMNDSEVYKHCNLMVNNLNDAERLAIAL